MDTSGLDNKLLRDIFLLSADALAILDGEGRFVLWNAAAEGLFGFAPDEVVGKTPEELFVPEGIPDDRDRVLAHVRSGNPARFETQRKRKDGSLVPVEISVTPILDAEENIAARFSVYWDLTQRRLVEERLRKANRALRMLSNCNQALLRMKDEEGLLQEICRIVGQEGEYPLVWVGYAEDDPARTVRPAAHWGEGAKYLQSSRISWADDMWGQGPAGRAIRTGRPVSSGNLRDDPFFMPWQGLAREYGFSSCISLPLSSEQGVFGVLSVYSREKGAFDENELEILTENSEDLAYGINALRRERERENLMSRQGAMEDISRKLNESLDLDEVLTLIADSARGFLGLSVAAVFMAEGNTVYLRVEMPGGGAASFVPLPVGEGVLGKIAQTGEMLFVSDIKNDRRWMNPAWAEERGVNSLLAIPLKDRERVLGVLGLFSASERRYTGDEIQLVLSYVQYASIAIKNADAHSKLKMAYQDLARSQNLLVRSEKLSSIGTLAAGAAHEILNPANIISLHAQRMKAQAEAGTESSESAGVILRNVDRIVRICDDLRRFSRDEKPQVVPCRPKALLRNCLGILERQLRLANVRVEEHLAETSDEKIMGDPNQLEQVFFNLIRNAMDAMPQGGTLSVSSKEVTEGGTHWSEYRVADTGEGILPENLSRIFDPFFTTKPAEKGTGLGLSVSHGIVEAHGGRIWAESEPGRGAVFIVQLPLTKG